MNVGSAVAESSLIGSILTESPKTTSAVSPPTIWGGPTMRDYTAANASSISRPTSAPPIQEHVNTSLFNHLSPLEPTSEDPMRGLPEYSTYYHGNRNLNPRLPPPLASQNR